MTVNKNILIPFLSSVSFNISCSQQPLPYDTAKVSVNKELNFAGTDKRGIEVAQKKLVYYVEKDLKTLTAYENGKVKWKADVMGTCGEPSVGEPAIRYIKLENDMIFVVFGKHSFAKIHPTDGKVDCLGSD